MYGVSAHVLLHARRPRGAADPHPAGPAERQLISADFYNQAFTMHGVTMIFLVVMPLGAAFMNYLMPLQIGARDVAFPRLNALSFWVFLFGGIFLNTSWLLGGAPDGGWFAYAPNTNPIFSPSHGMDFYAIGLQITGIASLGRRHQPDRHGHQPAGAGHEPLQDAGVHVDGPGHAVPAGLRHAGHHRRRCSCSASTGSSTPTSSTSRPRAPTRCSGSTSSGSSAIPRSTS